MARAANLVGMVLGGLLAALGLLIGLAGTMTMPGSTDALLVGFLVLMWGTLLIAFCVSNLRRRSASPGA